jgi:hypothetical protein
MQALKKTNKTTPRSESRSVLKDFDRADIVRDVQLSVWTQQVDATPSGINLLSKMVSMAQGKRAGLSATQKSDMWCRWKAGQCQLNRSMQHHLISSSGNPSPSKPTCPAVLNQTLARVVFRLNQRLRTTLNC